MEENGFFRGTLIRGLGGFYTAMDPDENEFTLRCKKKFRHEHITPMVGDEVLFSPGEGEEHGWLEEILPRKSECLRPPVANAERLIIVTAPFPEPDLFLVDKMLVRAMRQKMDAVLAVNKCELDPSLAERLKREYADADVEVCEVSALKGMGLETLKDRMRGRVCCMTGQSGVGKSTLLNVLMGLDLETGEISRKIQRGKNTTRHAELLVKDGMKVLDTAGFSLLEMERDMDPVTLKDWYPEFYPYEGLCKFDVCCHDREPGCAVTAACREGKLDPERISRYRSLLEEVRQTWRERYD